MGNDIGERASFSHYVLNWGRARILADAFSLFSEKHFLLDHKSQISQLQQSHGNSLG